MSLYEFKESDAFDFARFKGIEAKQKGDELRFRYCPYCGGGHKGKKDRDTFAINLRTGQFKCLRASCSQSGNMLILSKDFDFSLGQEVDSYLYPNKNIYRRFKKPNKPIEPKQEALVYLESRGISPSTATKYQITVRADNPDILVFPFLDDKGELQLIKYRKATFDPQKDKNKEWSEANCKQILFGMYQCNLENKTLILTEGQIDSLSVSESGIENAVSVPTGKNGFTWFPHCWDWLQSFDTLIVFGDCEKGEITLLADMRRRFPGKVKAVRQQDYKGCKDANELLRKFGKESVRQAVEQAEIIPIRQIRDISEIKNVDLFSLPKIPTGISSLDRVLSGGIYLGQTVILTGKRGEGKSTLASQIFANALNQNKIALAYSGELPDYFFKRWLDLQLSGKHHVCSKETENGTNYYLTNSTVARISQWYLGRAYLYDNQTTEDEELEDLLKVIEKTVQQYGVELVLLDNLMTALDVSIETDLYRAQSKFVDKVVKLSKRLNIACILIAHPRKNRYGGDDTDEVAGSSDITNKVDIVMTYKRRNDCPDNQRYLSVSKNRLTGRLALGDKEISLYYDDASKRISDRLSDFNKKYSWEYVDSGFIPLDEIEQLEIPFE